MPRAGPPATRLQAARVAQGFTQATLIHTMIRRAEVLNVPVASRPSLQTMVSRWENGHDEVTDPGYRRLFREILGRTNEELGFSVEPTDDGADELRARLAVARTVDTATVDLFRHQVDNIRHLDRRFGAVPLLDQITGHVAEIERLLSVSPESAQRAQLADVLADAATLAGWEALDRGSLAQAWRLHETAKAAAREAGLPVRLAYAIAQQAFVLLDLGDTEAAVTQFDYARSLGTSSAVPALLATWLAAAHGEALAATGDRDHALAAFDSAHGLLPAEHDHPDLPFLMLSEGHLSRWRGHALTRLGHQEAIDELEHALHTLTINTARAQAGMLVDLAFAYSAMGDRDAALTYATQARRLATQVGSNRQRRRLKGLTFPTGRGTSRTA
jgi:tetratricopeptide (TPR) repeat protein